MPDLKPCPCGKTPEKLVVTPSCSTNWAWVTGDCCGEWAIEFRIGESGYAAWNDAPRKGEG